MKKIYIILVFLMTFFLCGCDPATFTFSYEEMTEKVSSIEFINYNNDSSEIINVESDSKLIFSDEKISDSKKLDINRIDELLKDLSNISFHLKNESTLEPVKECLKINLNNSHFYILSCSLVNGIGYTMAAEFDENSDFVRHIARFADRPSYEALINKYFG